MLPRASVTEGQEACTLVVSGLTAGTTQQVSVEDYRDAISKLKKRSDALVPDDVKVDSLLLCHVLSTLVSALPPFSP